MVYFMTKRIAHDLGLFLLGAAWLVVGTPSQGQVLHADGPLPSYEVATIKPADPNGRGGVTM